MECACCSLVIIAVVLLCIWAFAGCVTAGAVGIGTMIAACSRPENVTRNILIAIGIAFVALFLACVWGA